MEEGKRLKTVNGEGTVLPEAMIQHIQSFLNGKEAARTTVLAKSWYKAWLTCPTLDFDLSHFRNRNDQPPEIGFEEFVRKTMQRYQDLNRKIECFRLRMTNYIESVELLPNELIVKALKLGATDLNLELSPVKLVLPPEVLESETLLRLSVSGFKIDGNVRCSRLKSLSLYRVHIQSVDVLRDIVSCCTLIEELSLDGCRTSDGQLFAIPEMNMYELPKLRRLSLEFVQVRDLFLTDFASTFPCLKYLSVVHCDGCDDPSIGVSSPSLERISFVEDTALTAEFHVPNLVNLSFSGEAVPSISIASSKAWESHITLKNRRRRVSQSWFLQLHKLFAQLSSSKMSISISNKY